MSQRNYRKLTRFLFLLLFLLFFLLYLLLRGQTGGRPTGGTGREQWEERHLTLGQIQVSEIRSGGFIVDQFPLPASTVVGDGDFDENVIICATSVHNEVPVTVTVTPSIYGSQTTESGTPNPGLCGGFYSYGDTADPGSEGYAALLSGPDWTTIPHGEKALELHIKGSAAFSLEPGETRQIVLFFWTDGAEVPTLTDRERLEYSVTVKLTSRASI